MASRSYRTADPHWITARRSGKCSGKDCGAAIKVGDRAFYYPSSGALFAMPCGHAEENARDFASGALDEEIGGL